MSRTFGRHRDANNLGGVYNGFQGQTPEKADIIIVGLDANWPETLGSEDGSKEFCEHDFFRSEVKPYLQDFEGWYSSKRAKQELPWLSAGKPGIGIHHPFLSCFVESRWSKLEKDLQGNGLTYHQRVWELFSLVRLSGDDIIPRTCFTELLASPTTGSSSGKPEYIDLLRAQKEEHFQRLRQSVFSASSKKLVLLALGSSTKRHLNRTFKPHFGKLEFVEFPQLLEKPVVRVVNHYSPACEVRATVHITKLDKWQPRWRVAREICQFLNGH